MRDYLQKWLFLIPGVFLAAWAVDGIVYKDWPTLIFVAGVLAGLNLIVRPLLILFALPFVVFTMGLGIFLINGLLLMLAGNLVSGFDVRSYGAAFFGSLIVSLVSFMVNVVFGGKPGMKVNVNMNEKMERGAGQKRNSEIASKDDDVIDV